MKSKSIALIVIFAAISVALVPFRIPAPYWPGMYIYWTEIPIVVAYLLFGFRISFSSFTLFQIIKLFIFPSAGIFLGFAISYWPLLTMLLGVYVAQKFISKKVLQSNQISDYKKTVYLIAFAIAFRASIMPFIDYVNYHTVMPFFLGQTFSELFIATIMPGIILHNIVVPLYTVYIGYFIARIADKRLKIDVRI
jgi:riboflavin transporter FmnP